MKVVGRWSLVVVVEVEQDHEIESVDVGGGQICVQLFSVVGPQALTWILRADESAGLSV